MNRNLNVFWGLVLCVGMIGGLIVLSQRGESGSKNGNPNEFYNSSSARTYSHVSSSAPVLDGVGVPMSSTSAMRRGSSFVYAPAYTAPAGPIASSPNGPIASSPITYTSSSAMTKSFGSGMGAGVSMSGGAVRSSNSSFVNNSIAVSSVVYSSISSTGSDVVLAENAVNVISSTQPVTSGSYYDAVNTGRHPMGLSGRRNSIGFGDSWWVWLDTWVKNYGTDIWEEGNYVFDRSKLEMAYNAFVSDYWNSQMGGDPPSFDEWLDWYQSYMQENGYDFNGSNYSWLPVGSILPLIFMALLYMLILFVKRNKTARL